MKLTRYRVTEFRSVQDSGWIDIDSVTTLVGTNESGKTNMLVPLWKLNPSEPCPPDAMQDMPRKKYHYMRNMEYKPVFVTGCFRLSDEDLVKLTTLAGGADMSLIKSVYVGKNYDNKHFVEFVDETVEGEFLDALSAKLEDARKEIAVIYSRTSDKEKKDALDKQFDEMQLAIETPAYPTMPEIINGLYEQAKNLDPNNDSSSLSIAMIKELLSHKQMCMQLGQRPEIKDFIINGMPQFVYYSHYGNIDSEIYLPQVIANFKRDNLGVKESAKVRTLKMLFDFVKLDPEEILTLGKETQAKNGLTDEQIKFVTKNKKEREILLQSAATEFTNRFRNWWKQGNYTFDFQADGDFFRIWVSDDQRSDKIELESRSAGLQWFFSFYLTYLIQSENKSRNSVLILDEPGMTLHPIAQVDLFNFFEGLSADCQIIFSTHSPYLLSTSHLSRVMSVFVDPNGNSVTSNDLRTSSRTNQINSVYPIHSALNLLISEQMLSGCIPVIVNTVEDQMFMNIIRSYMISQGDIRAIRDMVFIPSGGINGIKAVLPILVGKNNFMPFVILPADEIGISDAAKLRNTLFSTRQDRVVNVAGFGIDRPRIEDLIPVGIMSKILFKIIPKSPYAEEEFEDVYSSKLPVMEQVNAFCNKYELTMPKNWKMDLARRVKAEIIKIGDAIYKEEKVKYESIKALFAKISKL